MDNVIIKEASRFFSPEIAIEKLQGPEPRVKGSVQIFVQQFFPSKYEVGDVFDVCINVDEELDALRKIITEKTGCKNVVLTIAERWESYKLLNIYSNSNSFKPTPTTQPQEEDSSSNSDDELLRSVQNPKHTVRRLQPRDGEIVYFWDNEEPLKKLTEEEKKSLILKERGVKNRRSRFNDREESLHIKEKDVKIEDE